MTKTSSFLSCCLFIMLLACHTREQEVQSNWQPQNNPMMTRWVDDVSPRNVHQEYPRPQLTREEWLSLNGMWDYAITPKDSTPPTSYEGQILVPFPIESALSGVKKMLQPAQKLWYRRTFQIPETWPDEKILLHFGAVDWETTIWINGQKIETHRGGYDPFTLDITSALSGEESQEIIVEVWDPTDEGKQPVGKQTLNPRGIWYTPTSGIWRTVWLEPVPESYITQIRMTPDIDENALLLEVFTNDKAKTGTIKAVVMDGEVNVAEEEGADHSVMRIPLDNPKLWSPSDPYLYDLRVRLEDNAGKTVDEVGSYFGMRKVSVEKDAQGYNRIFLNNEPLFQFGPLDQGFWPDGLYTAPTDEALRYDVEITKQLGFNMARKHVKVEPDRWYYWCDKLGLLVWQDMPSGDERIRPEDEEIQRSQTSAEQFETELKELMDDYYNHPSIVMWVVFNEGWGQYNTKRLTEWAQDYDTTRLINPASGWKDMKVGDVQDMHEYPGPDMPETEPVRVAVLGEFGGQALAVENHLWLTDFTEAPTHFNTSKTMEALRQEYTALVDQLNPLIEKGLSAAVYTQTTDVEIEVNGLLTYDREVIKINPDTLAMINQKVYILK